ncbi:MAG: PEP-CTERM sorting domain-containing protein [Planctomycetota bacterium]|nr:MAG: PEP-CTERM sorting domain-containing protein [Planctomycetota bacterium]
MRTINSTPSRPFGRLREWVCAPLIVALAASCCQAITINAIYRGPGELLGTFGTAQSAPANAVGGGTLQAIMDVAVDYWESAYGDPFTLTVQYGWFPRTGSTTGTHRLLSEGGTPHRETSAAIALDSDGSTIWFADPTPTDSVEFSTYTDYTADLGAGVMNVGREFTGGFGHAARHDLFTTVLHEVGHALGLSSANNAFVAERGDNDVDVLSPLPFAGSQIPLNSGNAHLNMSHPLMRSSRGSGVRRLASEADILANAQISQFTQVNLMPLVPEPATWVLLAAGVSALPLVRRRRAHRS